MRPFLELSDGLAHTIAATRHEFGGSFQGSKTVWASIALLISMPRFADRSSRSRYQRDKRHEKLSYTVLDAALR